MCFGTGWLADLLSDWLTGEWAGGHLDGVTGSSGSRPRIMRHTLRQRQSVRCTGTKWHARRHADSTTWQTGLGSRRVLAAVLHLASCWRGTIGDWGAGFPSPPFATRPAVRILDRFASAECCSIFWPARIAWDASDIHAHLAREHEPDLPAAVKLPCHPSSGAMSEPTASQSGNWVSRLHLIVRSLNRIYKSLFLHLF